MTDKVVRLFDEVCYEDDFDAWTTAKWATHLADDPRPAVLQYQTPLNPLPPGHLGGWVLQKPNPKSPYNFVAIPLNANSEVAARAEALELLEKIATPTNH